MPRGRLRARVNWTLRWGGLVTTAAILFLYAVTCFVSPTWVYEGRRRDLAVWMELGQLRMYTNRWAQDVVDEPAGSQIRAGSIGKRDWRYSLWWGARAGTWPNPASTWASWRFPLWPVLPFALAAMGLGWLRPERFESACPSCRYDLSGLPRCSPCPECAAKVPPHH